ncbi:MAG: GDSL-type esterase/lipase family protein [Paludibacter sp.]|nr:GDSL-type esterase/lipase family protein [Paludibacter sp.]
MKRIITLILLLFILSFQYGIVYGYKIVVLGSSTAAGVGPTDINNAWVNRYRTYVQSINSLNTVINLAVSGYTTCQIMPVSYIPPTGKEYLAPDPNKNITKALSLNPQAIIINLPSNDIIQGISIDEMMSNYATIVALAAAANVPVWISTSQPRNEGINTRNLLILLKNKIIDTYQDKALDFWTTFANVDGTINTIYDSGDGIHLNDIAHGILFQRVVNAHILDITSNKNDTADALDSKVTVTSKGDIVTVSFKMNPMADGKLTFYNLLGKQVYSTGFTSSDTGMNQIQTSIKDPGLYFARLSFGKTSVTVKFVK